ncbi:MAG: pyruvate synthase subunit PorB [Syntrophaceae bacterium]|jgi:pyruvate ferredoxin oxidoreductase beta subunit|nr:pyruvate synthase subunit PorB [Syntrophaceae bacterium]
MAETAKNKVIKPIKNFSLEEYISSGHRACQGCAEVLAVRHVLKAIGPDMILAMATGCMEIISSPYPLTSWNVPWIHVAFENAAAVASGVESGLKALRRKGRVPDKDVTIVAMGGDGGTTDIGFQALSGMMERGHKVIYVCVDNEAYMNTGIQRSSSTPFGATTTTSPAGRIKPAGQMTWKKDMVAIAAAHGIPYTATACPTFFTDLQKKIQKAKEVDGPSYIHILSVCPTGWRIPPNKAIEYGQLAVDTGVFPLYEVEKGVWKLNRKPKELKPISEYFKGQGRYRHLDEKFTLEIQDKITEKWNKLVKLCE